MGGTIIAQDPETAESTFLCRAIKFAKPDYILTVEEVLPLIAFNNN
jgi:hypothetical protein